MGECSERVCCLCAGEDIFQVEVGASEEAVRLGQALNITCLAPLGPAFQQQWLHPKKQASELGQSLSDTAYTPLQSVTVLHRSGLQPWSSGTPALHI